jgi:RNA polymerase sigma-70 factor (ECF subfamily)
MLDERQAVEQARRGHEAAWRYLYEGHAGFVFRLAVRTTGDRAAALDVVQETFARAAAGIGRFRGESSFRSWLARIAINETTNWVRRRARRRELAIERADHVATGDRPDEEAARRDMAERALAYARTLPPQQRDALILRTTEGLTYGEIARALRTSEGSVRVSYHHAIRKLREHFGVEPAARSRGPEHDEECNELGGSER